MAEPKPEYYTTPNKQTAVKLNLDAVNHAVVASLSPAGTHAVSFFVYPEGTATLVGCQSREATIDLLRNALEVLEELVSANANLHEPEEESDDPEKPS